MIRIVTEQEFSSELRDRLSSLNEEVNWVTGPGRSGAIASVYASHYLGIPFVPYGDICPKGIPLIIDTATNSGRTLRKAKTRYKSLNPTCLTVYTARVKFWYEFLK